MRCHICNSTLPHPHARNCTCSCTLMLTRLQSPSHPDARTSTTLKDITQHRKRHHGSSPHNDTAPQRSREEQPREHTYKILVTQFNRTKMGYALRGAKTTLSQTKTRSYRHTERHAHKSRHYHRIHKHRVSLRKVTRRSITHCTPRPTLAPLYGRSEALT